MHLSIKFSLFVLGGVLLQSLTYAIPLTSSTKGKSVERRTTSVSSKPTKPTTVSTGKPKCDDMPAAKSKRLKSAQEVPYAFFVSYETAADFLDDQKELKAYISSQAECPNQDTNVKNKIVTAYQSTSGGGAILSGLFDRRVHKWLSDRIEGHEDRSLEPVKKLDLAAVIDLRSHWGLSRLNDKEKLPVQAGFTETTLNWPNYLDNTKLGDNSRIYILDTGVRGTSQQFLGPGGAVRVKDGQTFAPGTGAPNTDVVGHGTAVAAIAAGVSFGVAKLAIVIPFKLTDTRFVDTDVLALAINKAVDDFAKQTGKVGVINISIEFGHSVGVSFAMNHARNKNMHVVVAAGNGDGTKGIDRCQSWIPLGDFIAVGATNLKDNIWKHSNYGKCVDLYAPGESIAKALHTADIGHVFGSGTSYAAPFVAGVIAVVATSPAGTAFTTPKLMKAHLISTLVVNGKIQGFDPADAGKSHNRILQHIVQHPINLPPPSPPPGGGGGGGGGDPPAGDDDDEWGEFATPAPPAPGKDDDDDEFGDFVKGTAATVLGYILSGKVKRAFNFF